MPKICSHSNSIIVESSKYHQISVYCAGCKKTNVNKEKYIFLLVNKRDMKIIEECEST